MLKCWPLAAACLPACPAERHHAAAAKRKRSLPLQQQIGSDAICLWVGSHRAANPTTGCWCGRHALAGVSKCIAMVNTIVLRLSSCCPTARSVSYLPTKATSRSRRFAAYALLLLGHAAMRPASVADRTWRRVPLADRSGCICACALRWCYREYSAASGTYHRRAMQ